MSDGYAVSSLAELGDGPGFVKIRSPLGVTAFGVNAIVIPPGRTAGPEGGHYHEEQEELYFVHAGQLTMRFGDGAEHVLEPGGLARVDARTVRSLRNDGDQECVYLCVGGKDGYVGHDGRPAG